MNKAAHPGGIRTIRLLASSISAGLGDRCSIIRLR